MPTWTCFCLFFWAFFFFFAFYRRACQWCSPQPEGGSFLPPPSLTPPCALLHKKKKKKTLQGEKKEAESGPTYSAGLRGPSTDAGAEGPTTTDRDAKPVSCCCWQWYSNLIWVIAVVGNGSRSVPLSDLEEGWSNQWEEAGRERDKWDASPSSKVPLCKACNVTSNLCSCSSKWYMSVHCTLPTPRCVWVNGCASSQQFLTWLFIRLKS